MSGFNHIQMCKLAVDNKNKVLENSVNGCSVQCESVITYNVIANCVNLLWDNEWNLYTRCTIWLLSAYRHYTLH